MADSKKYDGSTWEHSLRKLTTATADIEPTIYTDGTAITAYSIKGNTVQSGTPTPANPVDVNGVGERTENLYNNTYYIQNANRNHCTVETLTTGFKLISNGGDTYLGSAGKSPDTASSTAINSSIEVKPETKYTLHLSSSPWCFVSYIGADGAYLNSSYINIPQRYVPIDYTFTTPANCKYVLFRLGSGVVESGDETSITDIMLVEGETAPTSYIPYGYKIPISTLQGTSNIYLSEPLYKIGNYADVINADGTITRNIGHIKLNTLTWSDYGTNQFASTQSIDKIYGSGVDTMLCDTYICAVNRSTLVNNAIAPWNSSTSNRLVAQDNQYSTAADWIAAMGDVGIWFILATPTTEQITLPTIPTTEGANSITVDTTVQPSEFTATWTGWHNAYVKKKSENLFDKDNTTVENAYLSEVDNEFVWYVSSDSRSVKIPCEGNTEYTLSVGQNLSVFRIALSSINDVEPTGVRCSKVVNSSNISQYTFTTSNNDKYIIFQGNAAFVDIWLNSLMLVKGSTALPYAPYWE